MISKSHHFVVRWLPGALILGIAYQLGAQTFKLVHSFSNAEGIFPEAGLVLSGNTLYGACPSGGGSGEGTVFAVNTDGTSFRRLHSFAISDGAEPETGLILFGNTLYGATKTTGVWGVGTVFSLNTDGTGFTTLYNFSGTDGKEPAVNSPLIFSGGTLFGTTLYGGNSFGSGSGGLGYGTVFAIATNGAGFATLYNFTGALDGAYPRCGLVLSGNTLYGITSDDNSINAFGTVFKVKTDGTDFTTLYGFPSLISWGGYFTNSDGAYPWGSLILAGSTLYGTAEQGGSGGLGTVFKVNTDGTGFAVLHSFTGLTNGNSPRFGLLLSGSTLYGTTVNGGIYSGGNGGFGTVFALNTDGTGFTVLHRFAGGVADGRYPYAPLLISGNTLYGTTSNGGSGDYGTIFSISFTPQLTMTHSGSNVILSWSTNYVGFDYSGYTLQSATNLTPFAIWTNVSPVPIILNGQYTVTNPISGTRKFYRLVQ